MKRKTKLAILGAAAATVGALLYKHYQGSCEQLPEEKSDFVVTEPPEDDFEYMIEDQIMFEK